MMKNRNVRALAFFALLTSMALVGSLLRGKKDPSGGSPGNGTEDSGSAALPVERSPAHPTGRQAPRLALPTLEPLQASEEDALAVESQAEHMRQEQFFAEERRIMAKTWGLTQEQALEFELASDAPRQERQALFDRYIRGEVAHEDMPKEFKAADERANRRLRDVLGPARLLEYQLMRGHFVEAGLDHKPFVPPGPVAQGEAEPQPAPPPPL
jgi:hypothetical protein